MADPIDTTPATATEYVGADPALSKAWGRAHGTGPQNPGANAYGGPSSLTGKQKAGPSAVPATKSDPLLDAIAKGGTARVAPDWQTRPVDASGRPASFGLKRQSAGIENVGKNPTIPGASGV